MLDWMVWTTPVAVFFCCIALMLVGISVLGIVTASVATWFVQSTQETEDEVLAEARHLVDGIRAHVARKAPRLAWLALDLGTEALLLCGGCALATAPFGAGKMQTGDIVCLKAPGGSS
jgi:hypothetical protein